MLHDCRSLTFYFNVGQLIRRAKAGGEEQQITLPPIQEYLESAEARRKALLSVTEQKDQKFAARYKKPLLDFE